MLFRSDTKNPYIFEDYHIRNSLNGPTFIALKKGHFKWGLMMVCLRSWKDDSYSSLDQKEIDLINFFSEKGCMKDVYPWNKCKLYEYKWVLPFEYQLERIVMMVEMK